MVLLALTFGACGQAPAQPEGTGSPQIEPAARCSRDVDCVLLPSVLSCCGECPPAPPFEAAARWVLDGMLLENETVCAASSRLCQPTVCDAVPDECVARAECSDGRCVVAATGCERPSS